MKTKYLEERRRALTEKREKLLGRFSTSARAGKSTARTCTEIRRVNDFLATLDQIVEENTPKPGEIKRYAVSSLFLHDCFQKLTADPDEQFFFITGSEVEHVYVL